MKKFDFGQATNTLANLGVIAGIVFLAVQINQSNRLARAQMRNDISQSLADAVFANSAAEVVEFQLKVEEGPDNASRSERRRYARIVNSMFRRFENTHYQYRIGLFDDTEFEVERAAWREYLNSSVVQQIWCVNRHLYSAEFRADFDSLLEQPGCQADQP